MSATPARPLPLTVRDKLGKLLPMLSSDHDGERVGAVAAIERVLKNHGRDWHDLAAVLVANSVSRERPQPPAADDGTTTMRAEELIDLIATVRNSGVWLGSRSEEFLDNLLQRARNYAFVFISPKQQHGLDDLVRKATPATP
jgi:hypothetical protein